MAERTLNVTTENDPGKRNFRSLVVISWLGGISGLYFVSVAEAFERAFGASGLVNKGRILILWVLLLFTRNPKENKDASEEGSCVVFRVVR
jgi:hypothetical protein